MTVWNKDKDLQDTVRAYREYDNEDMKSEMESLGIKSDLPFSEDMSVLNTFALWAYSYERTKKNIRKLFPAYDMKDFYILNSDELRSDEFTSEHDGKHVLFAGCSMTAGEGIPEQFLWTRKLYNKLAEEQKLSGYFNVAFPGATIMEVIIQVFKYIGKYGNPELIFINFPDMDREYVKVSSIDIKEIDDDPIANVDVSKINYLIIGMFFALSQYCKSQGIKLYPFSWSTRRMSERFDHFDGDPRDRFDGFKFFDEEELGHHCHEYTKIDKADIWQEYYYQAFDESHAGIALQDFYYHFAYDMYANDK
jgi:hypothetical protein